jgi:DNA-binding HxlR family transcriptional regulator
MYKYEKYTLNTLLCKVLRVCYTQKIMFRTKLQHKACAACPVAKTADLIGDSSVILIVRDLAKKPARFSDLVSSLPTISTRTLTGKLKLLEKEGLIEKKKFAEFPPRVLYTLTKKGKGLSPVMKAMEKYGKTFLS